MKPSRVITALTSLGLLLATGCGGASAGLKAKLAGEWRSESTVVRFSTNDVVWVEQRSSTGRNGKEGRYTIKGGIVQIEGMGTAELMEDGRLHVRAHIENALASSNIDDSLVHSPAAALDTGPASVELRGPADVVGVLEGLKGKYALYAHRSANISKIEDLTGKRLSIALVVNRAEDIKALGGEQKITGAIIGDAERVIGALHLNATPSVQNSATDYLPQLLQDSTAVGLLLVSVAESLGVSKSSRLVRLSVVR